MVRLYVMCNISCVCCCTCLFIGELIIKIAASGWDDFWHKNLNKFDFIVCIFSLMLEVWDSMNHANIEKNECNTNDSASDCESNLSNVIEAVLLLRLVRVLRILALVPKVGPMLWNLLCITSTVYPYLCVCSSIQAYVYVCASVFQYRMTFRCLGMLVPVCYSLFASLFAIMLFFSQIGCFWFGGLIYKGSKHLNELDHGHV